MFLSATRGMSAGMVKDIAAKSRRTIFTFGHVESITETRDTVWF